jgi:acyl-CoA synthetase (AMP-forming)/AMP-acid ligase II/alcohol dehydrogenase class IV
MENPISAIPTIWSNKVAVEEIGGIPFKMYVERPKRISDIFPFHRQWGARPYVIQGDRVLTFEDLNRFVREKIKSLVLEGVKSGDKVFIIGWNSPDWVINFWATVCIGAVPVAANAWWSEHELSDALNALKPVLILADKRALSKVPSMWRVGIWENQLDNSSEATDVDSKVSTLSTYENEPAAVIFTSGTDGKAKAVVLAHRSLLATLQMLLHISRNLPHQVNENSGEIILHTGPLFHIGGAGAIMRGVIMGNTLVMPEGRFDPVDTLALIERHKISRWNAVPTMITRLLEHPDVQHRDLRSLRTLTLGGAPVFPELYKLIRNGLPGVETKVATGYGLTENCGQATAASGADTANRPGTCGRPLPCVELKIVHREGMTDGEVLVRSPSQMLGYYGIDESPIDSEGWLHTGDLGYVDQDGYLWITGRSKDIIIRGGENISPAAVEQALLEIPGISEAAVFGVPHSDLGEEVMAVVVTERKISSQDLQEQLRNSLASFAVPSKWLIRKEKLPVNLTGKVDKAAVKAEVASNNSNPDAKHLIKMQSFQHVMVPLRVYQGADCFQFVKRELERLNSNRAVIFCGASIAREGTLIDLVITAIGDRYAGLFNGVKAHSPVQAVKDGAQLLQQLDADAIIAVGGGSAMVTARAASILQAEKQDIKNLSTVLDKNGSLKSPRLTAPKLPQLIITTTPTTAMVKAGSAVLDPKSGERLALFDPKTRVQSIFIHPEFLMSAPESLVLGSALNTFAMAIEGLTSLVTNPLADAQLMHAIRLSATHLTRPALKGNVSARSELVHAAILCGQGTDFTGLGITTALGHIIGSYYHQENGIVNAIVLPHVLRFNAEVNQDGLQKVAIALGIPVANNNSLLADVIGTIENLLHKLSVPPHLRDIGVKKEGLEEVAKVSMGDWFVRTNPRKVRDYSEVQRILELAW